MYDVLIIGGGAAGLTAALYTGRKKLKTGIITVEVGGQTLLTDNIENYPGVDPIPGAQLMSKFREQAEKFGSEFIFGEVNEIFQEKNKSFEVKLSNGEKYNGKTLIFAGGKTARKLGIPGEDKFLGRGISTCATCDAAFFKNKNVAVIGGGNSALDASILLEKFAKFCNQKNIYIFGKETNSTQSEGISDENKIQNIKDSLNIKKNIAIH